MAKRKTLMDEIHKELRGDRALDALYQRELGRLEIANQIAALRERRGLSQAALARRLGTRQAGVARMERSQYRSYNMKTLAKVAAVLGAKLEIRFVPDRRLRAAKA